MAATMLRRSSVFLRPIFIKPAICTKPVNTVPRPIRTCQILQCCYHGDGQNSAAPESSSDADQSDKNDHYQEMQSYREPLKPMARDKAYHDLLCIQIPDQPDDAKILKVAIIGSPNAGKSTLINQLMGRWVSTVSRKVHTTRKRTTAVMTEGDTQIVFLDTPGMTNPKSAKRHSLGRGMLLDPRNVFDEAQLVIVLIDVSNKWTRYKIDPDIMYNLYSHSSVPSILVINKTDMLRTKHMLLGLTAQLTEGMVGGQSFEVDTATAKLLGSAKTGKPMSTTYIDVVDEIGGQMKEKSQQKLHLEKLKTAVNKEKLAEIVTDLKMKQLSKLQTKSKTRKSNTDESLEKLWNENFAEGNKTMSSTDENATEMSQIFSSKAVLPKDDEQFSDVSVNESCASELENDVSLTDESADYKFENTVNLDELEKFLSREDINEVLESDIDEDILESKLGGIKRKDLKWIQQKLKKEKARRIRFQIKKKSGWPRFDSVFMVSALQGEGVDELQDYLFDRAEPGDWEFHPDVVTDQGPEEVISEVIRGKLLEYLPEEVPYQLQQNTEMIQTTDQGDLQVAQQIICWKKSHARMLFAEKGQRIAKITEEAADDLMNAFQCNVQLYLDVKLKKP
ncbi:GTPase Era, mitochondrial-like [Glandiceps talaboti]